MAWGFGLYKNQNRHTQKPEGLKLRPGCVCGVQKGNIETTAGECEAPGGQVRAQRLRNSTTGVIVSCRRRGYAVRVHCRRVFHRLVDWVSSHVVHKTKKAETWVTCLKDSWGVERLLKERGQYAIAGLAENRYTSWHLVVRICYRQGSLELYL